MAKLARIFDPRSVAVIGASRNPVKRGHQILRALDESRYEGRVYPVHPAGGRLLGRDVYKSVDALPEATDLAVICTPGSTAPDLVRACGRRGVAGAVVLAVGFGEAGAEGVRLQARLRDVARESGVRVIGPNTSGLLNLPKGVNLIGARGVRPGGIALLVQSGNIALDLMTQVTRRSSLGVSICCGLGNEVDMGFGEVLAFLGHHDETRAIVLHIEGCRDLRSLLVAAASVTPHKPVVAIKSGRTAAGAHVALSHTGTIAGPYDRLRAGFAQAGIVEVRRTDELLAVAAGLGWQPSAPPGTGVAILSDGGGQSTLAVDALHEMGVPLAALATETSVKLRECLGPAAAVHTPVDVAGAADSDPAVFARALTLLAADPSVGVILLVGLFGGYAIRFSETLATSEARTARSMAAEMRAAGKGLVVHSQYAAHSSDALSALRDAHVPVIESLEVACRVAAELCRRGHGRAGRAGEVPDRRQAWHREMEAPGHGPVAARPDGRAQGASHPVIVEVRAERRTVLTEVEARQLLRAVGAAFAPTEVVRSGEEAAAAAARAGGPVAIKLLSRRIAHKSDAGGVALDVVGAAAARAAFAEIAANARRYAHSRGLPPEEYGATVSPMLPRPVAELLVGAYRDPQLGPVLSIGAGGIWVEVLRDVSHRVLPVDASDVKAAIAELKVSALLQGARGGAVVPLEPIVDVALAVAACMTRWRDVAEVEINPLFAYASRAVPVDARVVLTGH